MTASETWKAFLEDKVPPGELRELLSVVEIVPDNTATPEDFIICGEHPAVPSESVTCSQCNAALFRSLQAPKAPKVICISCVAGLAE